MRQLDKESILVVNNLSSTAQAVELDLRRFKGNILIEMFGRNIFPRVGRSALPVDPGPVPVLLVPAAPDLNRALLAGSIRRQLTLREERFGRGEHSDG